jgi:hypothetical protein
VWASFTVSVLSDFTQTIPLILLMAIPHQCICSPCSPYKRNAELVLCTGGVSSRFSYRS